MSEKNRRQVEQERTMSEESRRKVEQERTMSHDECNDLEAGGAGANHE